MHESPFFVDADWRAEVEGARRARQDAEAQSRTPEALAGFRAEAVRELGAAGTPALSAKTEQRRQAWVKDRMVEAGRARAVSLGWPDAYAYTKAFGERALLQQRGDIPVSIVRPSIIESAWAEPRPGWIRGFRMAEPIIISYARGLLKEFPGVPEGTVDVIPVDMVVAAVIDAAAGGPPDEPEITQVASGSVNPLRYRQLVDLVREWFTARPLYDSEGQPIVVPDWSFPGRGRVQRQLERAKTTMDRAEAVLQSLPLRGRQAAWAAKLEERRDEAERALGYVELYGAYAECEAIYGVDRLLARFERLDEADRAAFCFDPRVVDWPTYVHDVHLPSVIHHARVRTTPGGRTVENRSDRLRRQVLAPERQFAAFDLENTLIASNVVASYSWLATRRLPREDRLRYIARTLAEAPSLLALDRRDRSDFLRHFYRRYDRAPIDQLDADATEMFSHLLLAKSFPAGIRRVREHRRIGHRTRADHRGPRLRHRAAAAPVRRRRLRPPRHPARRHLPRRADRRAADRRGAGVRAGRLRGGQRLRPGRGRRLRRLDLRPADARGRRLPRRGQPRDPPGGPRPQAGVAGRALRQGRRRPRAPAADRAGLEGAGRGRAPDPHPHRRRVGRQRQGRPPGRHDGARR